jgi:small-conductance mechanosensitive channel/CRP-like cAMP-binding protein
MGGQYHWVLVCLIAVAFGLTTLTAQSRLRLRAVVFLICVSFLGTLACALMVYRGMETNAAGVRYIHFAAQLLFSIAVINLASIVLFQVVLAGVHLQPAPILRDTILGLSYIIVALTLLGRHGVDLSGIVATSAVVTAVIGFSLQDTLGNIMGGMALQMEQSIAVGDWVRIGEVEGLVREIRWRQTSIETRNWDTVVIPNSVMMKSQVTVLGRRAGKPKLHRMWVWFNVDFRFEPAEVIDAVERALQAEPIPNVAGDPPPNCVLMDFKESYGHYAVRYWLVDFARDDPTSSEIRVRISVALQRAGMSMSIPAQTLFLKTQSEQRIHRKQKEETDRRVTALRGMMILQPLTDEELHELAEKLTVAPFRRGEIITRQGNIAHFLYLIARGEAEVSVMLNGECRDVARLEANDVFGEMGMLTGEVRTATVTAASDTVCFRLDKAAFKEILQKRPEIAEAISHLIAQRKLQHDTAMHQMDEEARRAHHEKTKSDLLERIRKFFTLS